MRICTLFNLSKFIIYWMEERSQKFKTQTFNLNSNQYLYEVQQDGPNSILKIYNSNAKLRSTQRLYLPAKCQVHTCQDYLIVLTIHQISLYKIPNTSSKRSTDNPGIQYIVSTSHNIKANLILILDNRQNVYYILLQADRITIKRIFNCAQLNCKINKVRIDYSSITKTLHKLKFDWNKNDKLVDTVKVNYVIDIYCRYNWLVLLKQRSQENSNKIVEQGQRYILQINYNKQHYENVVPKFNAEPGSDKRPIVKCTYDNFLYLDLSSRSIILFHDRQQISKPQIGERVPGKHISPNNLLFNVRSLNYKAFIVDLHCYQGLRQPFCSYSLNVEWLQTQKNQQRYLYIHNNIHLVLTVNGLSPHFYEKVNQYLNQIQEREQKKPKLKSNRKRNNENTQSNSGYEILACTLISHLSQQHPQTLVKLAKYLASSDTKLGRSHNQYIKYIYTVVGQVQDQLHFILRPQQNKEQNAIKIQRLQFQVKNIVNFVAILYNNMYATKQYQCSAEYEHDPSFVEQFDSSTKRTLSKNNICKNIVAYPKLLEKCKCTYLLVLTIQQHLKNMEKAPHSKILSQISQKESNSNIYGSLSSQIQEQAVQQYTYKRRTNPTAYPQITKTIPKQFKIGKESVHALLDDRFVAQVQIQDVFDYLTLSGNFYYSAYFYALFYKRQHPLQFIPYISDIKTLELLKFLKDSPMHQAIGTRFNQTYIIKNLTKHTAQALLINQPKFLQYICALSINTQEYRSCLAILVANYDKYCTSKQYKFIIKCLVLCDRVELAYDRVRHLQKDEHEYKQLLTFMIETCVESNKIRALLAIDTIQVEDQQYMHNALRAKYGEEIDIILSLMDKSRIDDVMVQE